MYLHTGPLASEETSLEKWVDISHAAIRTEADTLNFIYIGTDTLLEKSLAKTFQKGAGVKSFLQAQYFLDDLLAADKSLPEVLFIDMPVNSEAVQQFCHYCQRHTALIKIPLVYNSRKFCQNVQDVAQVAALVDDIIDFESTTINFPQKVSFLQKCKQQAATPVRKVKRRKKDYTYRRHTFSAKRLVDIVLAIVLIILVMPIFLLIALAIKIESKGPVIYTSLRAGKGFKIFRFFKFRTMEINADKQIESLSHLNQYGTKDNSPKFYKINNDPRVTRVGKFLRNTSLDELPQLLNVLIGDMSLVGNRPLPLYEASTLTTNEFVERFSAPAGITGLWQVKKRGKADMSIEERIDLDILYARKYSLLYDFWIMAHTPKALFQKSDV